MHHYACIYHFPGITSAISVLLQMFPLYVIINKKYVLWSEKSLLTVEAFAYVYYLPQAAHTFYANEVCGYDKLLQVCSCLTYFRFAHAQIYKYVNIKNPTLF